MHKRWFEPVVIIVVIFLLPMVILFWISGENEGVIDETTVSGTTFSMVSTSVPEELMISVYTLDGSVYEMELNAYILGVLMAEMPADFEPDALKAQAVVSRTYALKRNDGNPKHPGVVCTDASCCQGYITIEEFLRNKGTQEHIQKLKQAVLDTSNLVLVYNGELIEATYFSCSGGMTEDAVEVWGKEVPYLQATKSPGEENATHYVDTVRISVEELSDKLDIITNDNPQNWIGSITYTKGGGVKEMEIAGKIYSGTELRRLLGLRSTAFSLTIIGDTAVITTSGFGHRVGMSQYGAEAMAVSGKTFDDILYYYYTGTELMMYTNSW